VNKAEKSRPQRQPGAGQAETTCGARFPHLNCTKDGVERQPGFIGRLLSHGSENGVTLHHLEKMTGLSGREVRREIERERRGGELIISDNKNGYYLTDDPAEAQRFARSMRRRALEITRTARAVEKAAGGGD
jgi:hypothetical protein